MASVLVFGTTILLVLVKIRCTGSATVTYQGIGTFTTDDFQDPIYRPIVLLPKSPEEIDATFSLFTRNNSDQADVLVYNATLKQFRSTRFNPKRPTKMIVHGFNEITLNWMGQMKDNYLQANDLNVFLIEWPKASDPPYSQATANARVLGPMIGIFIENLVKAYDDVSLDSIHLIGHSLGGHVTGFAGKRLNGRLYRITSLDPAGPFFEGINQTEARLWHTDARFVDSIHTDGSLPSIPYSGLGMYETCSHVDIYPNGGRTQPGCLKERLSTVIFEGFDEGRRRLLLCSHIRSVDYFIESILSPIAQPRAYQCDDYEQYQQGQCTDCGPDHSKCVLLGPGADLIGQNQNVTQGKRYFMSTAKNAKYLRFQYLITIQMASKTKDRQTTSGVRIRMELIQSDGNRTETIEFNENKKQFEYGKNYSRVFVSDMDPGMVDTIVFILKRGGGVLTGLVNKPVTIRVDHLQILVLSPRSSSQQQIDNNNPNKIGKLEPPAKIKFVLDTNQTEEISSNQKKGVIFKKRGADATIERVLDGRNHN